MQSDKTDRYVAVRKTIGLTDHADELLDIVDQLSATLLKRADGKLEHKQENIMVKRANKEAKKN